MMKKAKLTIAVVLLTLFAVFVAQNTGVVRVHFLGWNRSLSMLILLPSVLVVGGLIGFLLAKLSRW